MSKQRTDAKAQEYKIDCHRLIDKLVSLGMERNGVYRILSKNLGLPLSKTHFALIEDFSTLQRANAFLDSCVRREEKKRDKAIARHNNLLKKKHPPKPKVPKAPKVLKHLPPVVLSHAKQKKVIAELKKRNKYPLIARFAPFLLRFL